MSIGLKSLLNLISPDGRVPTSMLPMFFVRESLMQDFGVRNIEPSSIYVSLATKLTALIEQCKEILEAIQSLLDLEKNIRKEEEYIRIKESGWESKKTSIQSYIFNWTEESELDILQALSRSREKIAFLRDKLSLAWTGFVKYQLFGKWRLLLEQVQASLLLYAQSQFTLQLQVTDVWKEWIRNISSMQESSDGKPERSPSQENQSSEDWS
eukprot:GHVP01027207.1.p1 GENE.GHVP01027207.1~~GHVP01027207.1.p1  ORF type:complete len:211 (+),score=37.98 GHVP01027207.1:460-1092(+)